ncbi:DUF3857 domain-containing protein [Paraburkholderia sp. IMGN_8]|uniref:DUF3857 domain-containing protein n=1 Tax=Paraburkholderia sp. IMGN_8 TaxID=3136564 RepID=UPI0031014B71
MHYLLIASTAAIVGTSTVSSAASRSSVAPSTIDKDGVKHPVAPGQIVDVQEPHAAGSATFEDAQLKAVIFPGVDTGSRLHLKFHKTQSVPIVAREFSYFVEASRGPVEGQR